jgi:tetratricopeptide (TPR) repeat protein
MPADDARAARERLDRGVRGEAARAGEDDRARGGAAARRTRTRAPARKAAEALLGHKVLAPRAAAALGGAYEKMGRFAEAAKCLAVEVDHFRGPRRVEAQKKLAGLKFQKLGDLAGALALYEQVVVLDRRTTRCASGTDRCRRRSTSRSTRRAC